jgi:tRNA (mo5U34)-methyltransferase
MAESLPTAAEREVADLLPIEADPADARAVVEGVPFWFHTFALNRVGGLYTPGVARDHRYRIPAVPERFDGLRVLDVGTFDGFYAFLAEARGARRVMAIDNEQYRLWVGARWGVELAGGEGFQAIHGLLGSSVEYRRLDAFELHRLGERFDFIYCFGILHRVESPLGLLRLARERLALGGRVLVETYGSVAPADGAVIHVFKPGEVYAGDDYVYWGFSGHGLEYLAALAGYERAEVVDTPVVDGHPRILATLSAGDRSHDALERTAMPVAEIGPTITATLRDGPLEGSSIEVAVVEGRPPKTIDVPADDGSTCRYCLAGWAQSGRSAVYTFLYRV